MTRVPKADIETCRDLLRDVQAEARRLWDVSVEADECGSEENADRAQLAYQSKADQANALTTLIFMALGRMGGTQMTDALAPVDGAIAAALSKARKSLPKAIKKDARNDHAGYSYASADSVYEAIQAPLFAAGLVPYQDETDFDTMTTERGNKQVLWARITYEMGFDLADVGRGTPSRHTQMVEVHGAQAMQAASTYALKYWLRGKLLLATGDQDIDASERSQPPATRQRPAARPGRSTCEACHRRTRRHAYRHRRQQKGRRDQRQAVDDVPGEDDGRQGVCDVRLRLQPDAGAGPEPEAPRAHHLRAGPWQEDAEDYRHDMGEGAAEDRQRSGAEDA